MPDVHLSTSSPGVTPQGPQDAAHQTDEKGRLSKPNASATSPEVRQADDKAGSTVPGKFPPDTKGSPSRSSLSKSDAAEPRVSVSESIKNSSLVKNITYIFQRVMFAIATRGTSGMESALLEKKAEMAREAAQRSNGTVIEPSLTIDDKLGVLKERRELKNEANALYDQLTKGVTLTPAEQKEMHQFCEALANKNNPEFDRPKVPSFITERSKEPEIQELHQRCKVAMAYLTFHNLVGKNYPVPPSLDESVKTALKNPRIANALTDAFEKAEKIKAERQAAKERGEPLKSEDDELKALSVEMMMVYQNEYTSHAIDDDVYNGLIALMTQFLPFQLGCPTNTQSLLTDSMELSLDSKLEALYAYSHGDKTYEETVKGIVTFGMTEKEIQEKFPNGIDQADIQRLLPSTIERYVQRVIEIRGQEKTEAETHLFNERYTYEATYNCWVKTDWKEKSPGVFTWEGGMTFIDREGNAKPPEKMGATLDLHALGFKSTEGVRAAFSFVRVICNASDRAYQELRKPIDKKDASLIPKGIRPFLDQDNSKALKQYEALLDAGSTFKSEADTQICSTCLQLGN